MKLIKFDTVHPKDYLSQKKENLRIQIEKFSYEEYLNWLIHLRSNYSDFFTYNLKRYGWEAVEFITNDFDLIRKAVDQIIPSEVPCNLQENEALKLQIIRNFTKVYKPDVIIAREQTGIASNFWNQFRENSLIMGVMSCPMPNPWYIGDYDVLITSTPIFRDFFEASGTPSYLIGNGFDERILNELTLDGPLHGVVFVGGLGAPVFTKRTQLMEYLSRNIEFKWWGYDIGGLSDTCRLKHTWQGQASGLDMFNIFNQAHIVLNDYGREAKGLAVNQRLYEIMGIGSFMLTRHSPNLAKDFPPELFATFHNENDCIDKIKYYLKNENERNEIAKAGQKYILEHFSYKRIMSKLHQIIIREFEKKFRKKLWCYNSNGRLDLSCNNRKTYDELAEINISRGHISDTFKSPDTIYLSAIVSTYNSERFIRGCIEDLENQTIADRLEIIVVNSGSEQNEEKIVKEIQETYSNIKYIKTEKRETVYSAWNRGIKAAAGKYITNANADDRHRRDALEIMVRGLEENHEIGAVYADTLITDKENETFEDNTAKHYFSRPNFSLRQMLLFSFFGPQPMWRRSVHQKIGYFDANLSVAGDYDFFIRLSREFGAQRIAEILGLYTRRSGSIENSNRGKCVSETLRVLKHYRNIIPLEELYPELKLEKEKGKAHAACLADQGNCCLFGDIPDIEGALAYYSRSLDYGYTEPGLAANLAVALFLSGNQTKGIESLRALADRSRPASHNLAVITKCIDKGELPLIGQLKAVEISHPAVLAATHGKELIIEENHFVTVETVEKYLFGSNIVCSFSPQTMGMLTDLSRPSLFSVSVIVPTFNRPEMLKKALKSILNQTYQNFEIVVINDGGENVSNLIRKFQDHRIKYIEHEKNRGMAAARNTGIKIARGKYIALLDDDDLFYPNHLKVAMSQLCDDTPVIYTDATRATYRKVNGSYQLIGKKVPYSVDFEKDKLLVGNISPINCFVFDKEKALQAGLFDETFTTLEDWEFFIRLSERCNFKHIAKVTAQVNWRNDGTTVTSSRGAEFKKNRERVYKRYQNEISKISNIQSIEKMFHKIWKEDNNPGGALVSIVILAYNQLKYTKKCIESIVENTNVFFELILVDNGSTDGTEEYLESELTTLISSGMLRIIKNDKNLGYARGNNQGMAIARGDYILLLNNDVVVTPGWLNRLIECAKKNSDIGIVGPVSNFVVGPQLIETVPYNSESLEGLNEFAEKRGKEYAGQAKRLARVVGFCMLIKREVVEKIGGLDPRYGLGNFEDDDFSLRTVLAGYGSCIAKDCFIHHFGNRTFEGANINYQESLKYNWKIFKEKWNLPEELPYGSYFSIPSLLQGGFIREKHFCSLEHANSVETDPIEISSKLPDDGPIEEQYEMVQQLVLEGKHVESVARLERLLKIDPDFAMAHNDLGILYYNQGDKEKALNHYEQAVRIEPHNLTFQKNSGRFLFCGIRSGRRCPDYL